MNKLSKKLFASIMAMSFITFSLNANDIENFEVTIMENSSVLKLEVNKPSLNAIDVSLYNAYEREILSERVESGETFETRVDFSELRNGTYTLVSAMGNMRLNKIFKVKNSGVELIDTYYSYVPVFRQEGDLLTVYYLNNDSYGVGISIEDNLDSYFDSYFDKEDEVFTKVFSLKNLTSGSYTFNLSSNGEFFTHEFEVE